jgi:hypothetical protein
MKRMDEINFLHKRSKLAAIVSLSWLPDFSWGKYTK